MIDQNSLDANLRALCSGQTNGYRPNEVTPQMIIEELDAGANIESTNGSPEMTPLLIATDEGLYSVVKCLLEKGANVFVRDTWGNSAVHLVSEPSTVPCIRSPADYWKIVKLLIKTALQQDPVNGLSILDIQHDKSLLPKKPLNINKKRYSE